MRTIMDIYQLTDKAVLEDPYWLDVLACYSINWQHFHSTPHAHKRVEIMYVVRGTCSIRLFEYSFDARTGRARGSRETTEKLEPGQFIFLDAGIMHSLEVDGACFMLNVEMAMVPGGNALLNLKSLAQNSPALRQIMVRGTKIAIGYDTLNQLKSAMEDVITRFDQGPSVDRALMDVAIARALLIMAENLQNAPPSVNVIRYMAKIDKLISTNLDTPIREADLAREVGISVNYMQRIIRSQKGTTLVKYINHLRIEKSKRLLSSYFEYSVMDIVIACGFNSRQHFFRVFKAETGMSPMQYRQSFFTSSHVDRRWSGEGDAFLPERRHKA